MVRFVPTNPNPTKDQDMEFSILILIAITVATAMIAGHKGRNAFGWAVLGFFFSIFALIVVCAIPALPAKEDAKCS